MGIGFIVQSFRFKIEGGGWRVQGLGFGVWLSEFRV
jgi:hypothetical protein